MYLFSAVCPVGKVLGQGNLCEDCPTGFYRDSITVENCTQCPNGLLTPAEGSNSIDDCSLSKSGDFENSLLKRQYFRPVQIESICRRQNIKICFEKGGKCGKRRKCWLPAFSPFPTMFSKTFSGSLKVRILW